MNLIKHLCRIGLALILSCCSKANEPRTFYDDETAFLLCDMASSAIDYDPKVTLTACNQVLTKNEIESAKEIEAYFGRGVAHRKLGDLDFSEKDLEKARRLSSNRPDILRMLAWTHRESAEYDLAVDIYNEAVLSEPNNWQGYLSRCVVLGADLKRYRDALPDCLKTIELGHISDDSIYFTSFTYNQLQQYSKAIGVIETHSDNSSASARIYEEYLVALIAKGELDKARRVLAAAGKHYPDAIDIDHYNNNIAAAAR